MIKELPSSIDVESVFDKKTVKIELGALYTMIPEYIFSRDDLGYCDILVCMPTNIDKMAGSMTFYIVGYEYEQLTPISFENDHLCMTFTDDSGDSMAIDVPAYHLHQYLSTMPRSSHNVVGVGPIRISICDFSMPAPISDLKHARLSPIGTRIKDMRQWPRKAVDVWARDLRIEPDQARIALSMDQKYKEIAFAQEMFVHRASDFNPVAKKKVKENRPKNTFVKVAKDPNPYEGMMVRNAAADVLNKYAGIHAGIHATPFVAEHRSPPEAIPKIIDRGYDKPVFLSAPFFFNEGTKERQNIRHVFRSEQDGTVAVSIERHPRHFKTLDNGDDIVIDVDISARVIFDDIPDEEMLAPVTVDVQENNPELLDDDLIIFVLNKQIVLRVKNRIDTRDNQSTLVSLDHIKNRLAKLMELGAARTRIKREMYAHQYAGYDMEYVNEPKAWVTNFKEPEEIILEDSPEEVILEDPPDQSHDLNIESFWAKVEHEPPEPDLEVFEEKNENEGEDNKIKKDPEE